MIKGLKGPKITIVDCNDVLVLGRSVKSEYVQDTYHLTSAGYVALNDLLRPVLQELVQNGLK